VSATDGSTPTAMVVRSAATTPYYDKEGEPNRHETTYGR
jgi:hypothetical protein